MPTRADAAASRAVVDVGSPAGTAAPDPAARERPRRTIQRMMVDASIGLLFLKGVLMVPVTIYTFVVAYRARMPTPIAGVASCAAGSFAFAMACFAAWVRKQLD